MARKITRATLLGLVGTLLGTSLVAAQQPLATMKDHMAQCMNKMSVMQQMQGGMGSHMQQKK